MTALLSAMQFVSRSQWIDSPCMCVIFGIVLLAFDDGNEDDNGDDDDDEVSEAKSP